MECIKCKLQCADKAETDLNVRINNHRKDVLELNVIPADQPFAQKDHDFNTDAKFTIIQQTKTKS